MDSTVYSLFVFSLQRVVKKSYHCHTDLFFLRLGWLGFILSGLAHFVGCVATQGWEITGRLFAGKKEKFKVNRKYAISLD